LLGAAIVMTRPGHQNT